MMGVRSGRRRTARVRRCRGPRGGSATGTAACLELPVPGWARSGQAGVAVADKAAYVQTSAGIVHVTVHVER